MPHADNPPLGAIIYYYLAARPTGTITLEIVDAAGKVVRHLSSAPIPPLPDPPPPVPAYWLEKPKPMPAEVGTSRINWNIRYDNPPAFTHNYAQVMGAVAGHTPASPEGPLALPGLYTLKLSVNDLKTAVMNWNRINTQDLPALNAVLAKSNIAPIRAASPILPVPVCTPARPKT